MSLNLESERLMIRNLKEEDLHHFFHYRSDPEVCRYQDWDTFDKEATLEFIKDQQKKGMHDLEEWVQLAIELKAENHLIGDIAFRRYDKDGSLVEVGYAITPGHQRKGYAFEALQLLISHFFDKMDVHKITARVDPRNEGSLGLLDRLNFVKEGHIRKCFYDPIDKEWVDEIVYGLLAEDFRR
ncbi:Ribosomal-protein-serine acetyltransferase [Fulvivirga imtechensis AK7]|uniref:Ribosomal-protein-serine acetyltransferase n=1 Tax=Fulvivirga imtechensis AK7 TaxID=1237149 RepID=L8JM58_9BACT|nr:GNAT family protein [Fulvivirga imtechensis]ELR70016.1 Ribosomal-protein-serine acetyltransferase [Fulvivirga imtechensis AK7]